MRRHGLVTLSILPVVILAAAAISVATRGSSEQRYEATGYVLESQNDGPEVCVGSVLTSLPPQCGGPPITNWDWSDVDGEESMNGTTWIDVTIQGTYDGERFTMTAPPSKPKRIEEPLPDYGPACDDPDVVDPNVGEDFEGEAFVDVPQRVAVWVSDPNRPDYDGPLVANVAVRPGWREEAREHVRKGWKGYLCVVERDQRTEKELRAEAARLPDVLSQELLAWGVDEMRGRVWGDVTVVDEQALREIEGAYEPGVVELSGALKPI